MINPEAEICRESRSYLLENIELSALVSLSLEYRQYSQYEDKQCGRFASVGRGLFLLVYIAWSLGGNHRLRISTEWLTPFFVSTN